MHRSPPYDPRAIANLLLDLADRNDVSVSNLALQKLLYFAHGLFLTRTGKPMVSGHFEAWTYGPVHPVVYQAFKEAGDRPIARRALSRNVMTGESQEIPLPDDAEVREVLREVIHSFGRMSAGRLVELSHAPNGPWAHVVDKARTSVSIGLRITDKVTLERFKYQKIAVGPVSPVGVPNEDSPLI